MLLRDPRGPRGGRWNASGPPPVRSPPVMSTSCCPKSPAPSAERFRQEPPREGVPALFMGAAAAAPLLLPRPQARVLRWCICGSKRLGPATADFDMINLCVETHNPAARPLETSQACSSLGDADSYETVGVLKSQASFLIEACYYAVRIGRGCASVQSRPSQHAHKLTPTAPQVLALTYSYCLATDNRSVHARTEPAPPGLAYPVQGVQAPDSTSVISR